ncbi:MULTISPECIES: MFS transporter [unclassified Actinopolyspora]|uniref:MFS transporter n=1 Tax=unclassified Actinopolyspora TaxID=2639451 RepID=UPI0013F63613|nr:MULTISPECIES: MFS transporter [unclassified Actinopolyspora]NHD19316.1 MFS transporter [Actinopolyspora sp. BKK2]NHE78440.1 MFS transporter [Actinopolyspora sp. BKK1]
MTASLRIHNFRMFAMGQIASVTGTWMMFTAQDWLVLRLSDDSAKALGFITAAQFAPVLLLTLVGGRLADRYDKRTLLLAANGASALLATALATAILGGSIRLWHIIACALGFGLVNAVEIPARMSFVGEMVGSELLPNASALSAAYFNTARVVGPAAAGLLISVWDVSTVILLNAASYLATVLALCCMRPTELHRSSARSTHDKVTAGLRYIGTRRDLLLPLALVAVVALVGFNFQVTLPLLTKTVFETGPASFGLLTAAMAGGSLLAALVTTARRKRPRERTVLVAALAFAVLEICSGFAITFPIALFCLGLTGFAVILFAQAANHRVQLGTDPSYRGRVMALYTLISQGTTPLGALLIGWLAEHTGARTGLWAAGLVCLAAALAALAISEGAGPQASGRSGGELQPPERQLRPSSSPQ